MKTNINMYSSTQKHHSQHLLFDYGKKNVAFNQIKYFESVYGNYTIVKLKNKGQIISSFTLKHYSKQLESSKEFIVIRKGLMINTQFVSKIEQRQDGHYVHLKDGSCFRMSRRKGKNLISFINDKNSI